MSVWSINTTHQVTIPYTDVDPRGYLAYNYQMYLNSACTQPAQTSIADTGPICQNSAIGHVFDLHGFLVQTDGMFAEWNPVANETTSTHSELHTLAARLVHMAPIYTIVPFIFYVMAVFDSTLLLALTPRNFTGHRRGNALTASIAGVSAALQQPHHHSSHLY